MVFSPKGKKVLIVGLGKSGLSALKFLAQEAELFGVDDSIAAIKNALDYSLSQGVSFSCLSSDDAAKKMFLFDCVVVSPGVSKSHPCYLAAISEGIDVFGEAQLASCLLQNKICIGVTGTNGKTTVTYLIEHVLNSCGIAAKAVGNCGVALTSLLNDDEEVSAYTHLVIELSSFQLETLNSKILDSAIILNITPDHLDRYESMKEYAVAKFNIFNCVKSSLCCYVDEQIRKTWKQEACLANLNSYGYDPSSLIYTDLKCLYYKGKKNEIDLPTELTGKKSHDLENFLAAFAIVQNYGVSFLDFIKAFASFKKPSHRIEFVADIEGIRFVNDSKGTNIDAVCRAVEAMPSDVVLIAGGVDKGASYVPWIEAFSGKVKAIFAIGRAASNIAKDLEQEIDVMLMPSLEEAVINAFAKAENGDTVLLSPGCASYDQFTDYAHRGFEFKKIVNKLAERYQKTLIAFPGNRCTMHLTRLKWKCCSNFLGRL